jgi:hypothetical protein
MLLAGMVIVLGLEAWEATAINAEYERNIREHPPEKLCPYCGVR